MCGRSSIHLQKIFFLRSIAARALGLGTVLTTLHTQYEHEIKALLRIPETVETAALIPVGYPAGERAGDVFAGGHCPRSSFTRGGASASNTGGEGHRMARPRNDQAATETHVVTEPGLIRARKPLALSPCRRTAVRTAFQRSIHVTGLGDPSQLWHDNPAFSGDARVASDVQSAAAFARASRLLTSASWRCIA
jgi:hypothetical protein